MLTTSGEAYSMKYETNPLISETYHDEDSECISIESLKDFAKGKKVVSERMRFVSDYGHMDLSYWHIRINGIRYNIINFSDMYLTSKNYKTEIYKQLKTAGVFIENTFNSISIAR